MLAKKYRRYLVPAALALILLGVVLLHLISAQWLWLLVPIGLAVIPLPPKSPPPPPPPAPKPPAEDARIMAPAELMEMGVIDEG